MPKRKKPPSQTWRAFQNNHLLELVSIDYLVVPTATFRILFVLVVFSHHRRRAMHLNVTEHPTALWTAEKIVQAFPDGTEPRYLLRGRDGIYGEAFRDRVKAMGIEEVLTAPSCIACGSLLRKSPITLAGLCSSEVPPRRTEYLTASEDWIFTMPPTPQPAGSCFQYCGMRNLANDNRSIASIA